MKETGFLVRSPALKVKKQGRKPGFCLSSIAVIEVLNLMSFL
jgi:hypothetical protein